jgi:branched-chain amino acid aminotransferase/4-amino-4-deoxychorismate lyase
MSPHSPLNTALTTDRGFTLGDGLFETILWADGALHLLDLHLQRLEKGCEALSLPAPDPQACLDAAHKAIKDAGLTSTRAAVRLNWSAGPGGRGLDRPASPTPWISATAAPAPRPVTPARLVTASVRRNEGSPASRLKTLSYLDAVLARHEAMAAGADEALMLNNRDEVCCAAAANLLWLHRGVLHTPRRSCGVLDGTIRRVLVDSDIRVDKVVARLPDLRNIQGLWLSNALIGLRPVSNLDGWALPLPELPGDVTALVRAVCPD